MNKQCIFGWFEGMVQESVVRTLNRWHRNRWFGNWNYRDGGLQEVGYQAWLRWYSPLCERGQS